MVYKGKPSLACDECRLRRTKCDIKKPSCSQCVRARRICKGYRDPGALVFRDESKSLDIRRQRAESSENQKKCMYAARASAQFNNAVAPIDKVPPCCGWSNTSVPITTALGPSAEDQARCFFLTNYVTRPTTHTRGIFDCMYEVYEREQVGRALSDSILAVGLAGLANFWKAPRIIYNARVVYSAAIRKLSSDLEDEENVTSNQTLMATSLLGLFETNTCSSQRSIETWTSHIKGAIILLQLRGKKQLSTSIGYHLYLHVRSLILANCAQQHYPVPKIIYELNRELVFENEQLAGATKLCNIIMIYCDLRASMSSFNDYSNPERIISEARKLDTEFVLWVETCPSIYVYETITLTECHQEVFADHYHRYGSMQIATSWNYYRCIRTLINELIVDQAQHVPSNSPFYSSSTIEDLIQSSKATLLQLCHDMCASVPYYLNFNPNSKSRHWPDMPIAVHGNLVLWPLYCAGCTTMATEALLTWVPARLRWIADVMGIRQAAPLAFAVAQRQDLQSWVGVLEDGVEVSKAVAGDQKCEQFSDSPPKNSPENDVQPKYVEV